MLIFEKSKLNRSSNSISNVRLQGNNVSKGEVSFDKKFLRKDKPKLPESSELDVVRHYTNLSRKNFSIDTNFYPLGSCTMKYNPRIAHKAALLPDFLSRHPLASADHSQGFLSCIFELQEILQDITGMAEVSLTPMAGAQGEFAGVAMIKAYHADNNGEERDEMLVPDSAHGTNPASAVMCGYKVKEIPTNKNGDLDLESLKKAVGPKTAGIMLTNPSTLGLFERDILEISKIVHEAGGLLYYDGANLNAILGRVRPGDMGFDVMHMNLHKTFATPHGGGGPGSGPIACNEKLAPYAPVPIVEKSTEGFYSWIDKDKKPKTIGRLSAFMGNAGILLRAFAYISLIGREGLQRVSNIATLNANYLAKNIEILGVPLAYPDRFATHEFIITFKKYAKEKGLTALDFAKRLLDEGFHAPTIYFPLLVPECWLIEPTETESKETLDSFLNSIEKILHEAELEPEKINNAPTKMSVSRLDEVKAAKELDLAFN